MFMHNAARLHVRTLCYALALLTFAGVLVGCAATGSNRAAAPKVIATLEELDTLATNTDAVFVYVPAKGGSADRAPVRAMAAAAGKMHAQEIEVSLFALRADSPDVADIATEVELPCILTLARGRGGVPVTGALTEEQLVKSFDAFQGGCSTGGCGTGGCGECGSAAEGRAGEGCLAPETK